MTLSAHEEHWSCWQVALRGQARRALARAQPLVRPPKRCVRYNLNEVGRFYNMSGVVYNSRRLVKALMSNDRIADLVRLVKRAGILRPRDLKGHGIPRVYLRMAVDGGAITRVGPGLYAARGARPSEHHSLAQASKRVPHGIVCLLSALRFHDLTTQSPFQVWLAISEKARLPKIDNPPLRIVRFSQKTLAYGLQEHRIEGVLVRIFSPAKTVADCFRYRNKIGLDVALEALRECRRKRRASSDDIWRAAKVCRMANVMRPYLESLS
jgi:predicted transcriptional regulator of viral defense system